MNAGSTSRDSSTLPSKKRKGPETETAETSSKKRRGLPPASDEGRFILNLNVDEDVVDAIFELSKAYPHQSVIINSATGTVSRLVPFGQNSPDMREGEFHIMSLSVQCLVGDDGRHCRAKAECSVILTDDRGIFFVNAHVNSLIAASPVEIIASTFTTDVAKEAGSRILAASASAQISNSDSEVIVEEVGQSSHLSPTSRLLLPTPVPATYVKIPTTTNSTENDQDMKSPLVEDT